MHKQGKVNRGSALQNASSSRMAENIIQIDHETCFNFLCIRLHQFQVLESLASPRPVFGGIDFDGG